MKELTMIKGLIRRFAFEQGCAPALIMIAVTYYWYLLAELDAVENVDAVEKAIGIPVKLVIPQDGDVLYSLHRNVN